uniref:Uncharacterized protein n=1 Tax=Arundo donax TaxID=35708 RepID=A0A0A9G5J3_ARUDO
MIMMFSSCSELSET